MGAVVVISSSVIILCSVVCCMFDINVCEWSLC